MTPRCAIEAEKVPLVVFAGAEYGTGSSRDWAAKGTKLLGVRAVIAQSFERIHRSNLVGMGVLPLVFEEGTSWQTLGLKGDETVTILGLGETLKPRQTLHAEIVSADGARGACRSPAASIRWTNSNISATAGFLPTCCGSWRRRASCFWVYAYPAFLKYAAHSAGGYWARISPQASEMAS